MAIECQRVVDIAGINRQWTASPRKELARHPALVLHGDERLDKDALSSARAQYLRRESLKRLAQITLAGALPKRLHEVRHGQCSRLGNHYLEVDDNVPMSHVEDLRRVALDRLINVALSGGLPDKIKQVLSMVKEEATVKEEAKGSTEVPVIRDWDLRRESLKRLAQVTLAGDLPSKLKQLHDRTSLERKREARAKVSSDSQVDQVTQSGEASSSVSRIRTLRDESLRRLAQAALSGTLVHRIEEIRRLSSIDNAKRITATPSVSNREIDLRKEVLRRVAQETLSGSLLKKLADFRRKASGNIENAVENQEVLRCIAQDTLSSPTNNHATQSNACAVPFSSANHIADKRQEVLRRLARTTLSGVLAEKLNDLRRPQLAREIVDIAVARDTQVERTPTRVMDVQVSPSMTPAFANQPGDVRQEVLSCMAGATLSGELLLRLTDARKLQNVYCDEEDLTLPPANYRNGLRQDFLRRIAEATFSGELVQKLQAARGLQRARQGVETRVALGPASQNDDLYQDVLRRVAQATLSGNLTHSLQNAPHLEDADIDVETQVALDPVSHTTDFRQEVLQRIAQATLSGDLAQQMQDMRHRFACASNDDIASALTLVSSSIDCGTDMRQLALRRIAQATMSGTLPRSLEILRSGSMNQEEIKSCVEDAVLTNPYENVPSSVLKCIADATMSGNLVKIMKDVSSQARAVGPAGQHFGSSQDRLRRESLKRQIAELAVTGTLPQTLQEIRAQQAGNSEIASLPNRRVDLRKRSLQHLAEVSQAVELAADLDDAQHNSRSDQEVIELPKSKDPPQPQDAKKRFAQFVVGGGVPEALAKIRKDAQPCDALNVRQIALKHLALVTLSGDLPQKIIRYREQKLAPARQMALKRLTQVTLEGGLPLLLKKFKDEQRAKRSGAIPIKMQTDDEARLSSLVTSQPPDASMPSSSLKSPVASSSSASSLSTSNSAPKLETCNDDMRDAYKELAIAGNMHLASKRAAKLATDLIFAIVLDKAGQQTNQQEFEAALNTLAKKTGMSEEMQDLAQSSATKLLQSSSSSLPEARPSVISKAVCQAVIEAANAASSRPAALKPSSVPNLRIRPKRADEEAEVQEQTQKVSDSAVTRPACLKPSSHANLTLLRKSPHEESDSEVQNSSQAASSDAPVALPESALRPVSMRPSSVPASTSFLRKKSKRPDAQTPTSNPVAPASQPLVRRPSRVGQFVQSSTLAPQDLLNSLPRETLSRQVSEETEANSSQGLSSLATSMVASVAEVHAALSRNRAAGMSSRAFAQLMKKCYELCKECDLTTERFTESAATSIFESVAMRSKRIDVQQFDKALSLASERMKVEESIFRRVVASVAAPEVNSQKDLTETMQKLNRTSSEPWFIRPSFNPSSVLQARSGLAPVAQGSKSEATSDKRKARLQPAEVYARASSAMKPSRPTSGNRRRPRTESCSASFSAASNFPPPPEPPEPPDVHARRTPPPPSASPTPSSPASPKRSYSMGVQRRARPRPLGPLCDAGEFSGVRKPTEKYPFPEVPGLSFSSSLQSRSRANTTDSMYGSGSDLPALACGPLQSRSRTNTKDSMNASDSEFRAPSVGSPTRSRANTKDSYKGVETEISSRAVPLVVPGTGFTALIQSLGSQIASSSSSSDKTVENENACDSRPQNDVPSSPGGQQVADLLKRMRVGIAQARDTDNKPMQRKNDDLDDDDVRRKVGLALSRVFQGSNGADRSKCSPPEVPGVAFTQLLQSLGNAVAQKIDAVTNEDSQTDSSQAADDSQRQRHRCASPEVPTPGFTQLMQSMCHTVAQSRAIHDDELQQSDKNLVVGDTSQEEGSRGRQRCASPAVPSPAFTQLMQSMCNTVAQSRVDGEDVANKQGEGNNYENEGSRGRPGSSPQVPGVAFTQFVQSLCSAVSQPNASDHIPLDAPQVGQLEDSATANSDEVPKFSSPAVPGKAFTDLLHSMCQTIASPADDGKVEDCQEKQGVAEQASPQVVEKSPFMRPSCATGSMLLYSPSPPVTPSVGRPQIKNSARRNSYPTVPSEASQNRSLSPASLLKTQSLPPTPANVSDCPFTVRDVYLSFCSSNREGLSCKGFTKLCKHVGLSNDNYRIADLNSICHEVLPKGKKHMNFSQFEHALMLMASNDDAHEASLRKQIVLAGTAGHDEAKSVQPSARSSVAQPSARSSVAQPSARSSVSDVESRCGTPSSLRPLLSLSRSPANTPPMTPVLKGMPFLSPSGPNDCLSTRTSTCSTAPPTARAPPRSEVSSGVSSTPPTPQESPSSSSSASQPASPSEVPQQSLRRLLKAGAVATGAGKRGAKAIAQDALDAALLFRVEATNQDILVEQLHHARVKASVALTFALLTEAREENVDVGPKEILEAREKVQRTLDFIFHSNKNMKVDAYDLSELRKHAQDAIRVALFDAQTSGNEEVNRSLQASAPEALREVFHLTSKALRGHLSGDRLDDAKKKAHEAVARAVIAEMKCCGIEVDNNSQKFVQDLKRTQRRVHAALDSTFLADADVCAAADYGKMQARAMNALHLAMIGVKIQS